MSHDDRQPMSPSMNHPTMNKVLACLLALGLVLSVVVPGSAPAATAPAKPTAKTAPGGKGKAAPEAPSQGTASGIDTEARNAYIIDFRTGAVLLDKNSDERIPPASMSKMMTYYTVF